VQLNAFPIDPGASRLSSTRWRLVKQTGYQGFEAGFRFVNSQFAAPESARRSIEQTGLTFFRHPYLLPRRGVRPGNQNCRAFRLRAGRARRSRAGRKAHDLSGAPSLDHDQLKRKIEALIPLAFCPGRRNYAAYHNHWWEFQSKIGEIETLYRGNRSSLVSLRARRRSAYHGGANVPEFIRAHSSRIIGFHLRDFKDGRFISLGQGTFPLAQVAAVLRQIKWKGWVENEEEREDHSQTGLKSKSLLPTRL